MKKIIALAIVLIMALTLAACGGNNNTPDGGNATPPANTPSGNNAPDPPSGATTNDAGSNRPSGDDEERTFQVAMSDNVMVLIAYNANLQERYDTTDSVKYTLRFYALQGGNTGVTLASFAAFGLRGDGIFDDFSLTWKHETARFAAYDVDFAAKTVTVVLEFNPDDMETVLGWKDYHVSMSLNVGDNDFGYNNSELLRVYPTDFDGDFEAILSRFELPDTSSNGNGISEMPDRGAPPDVPPPLESHIGDKAYFYATSDDYIVYAYDVESVYNADWAELDARRYVIISFDEYGNWESTFEKYVFNSEADAEGHKNWRLGRGWSLDNPLVIDNVLYFDLGEKLYPATLETMKTKEDAISQLTQKRFPFNYDSVNAAHYISKP